MSQTGIEKKKKNSPSVLNMKQHPYFDKILFNFKKTTFSLKKTYSVLKKILFSLKN